MNCLMHMIVYFSCCCFSSTVTEEVKLSIHSP
uniref:Uncharacterized protein n=1 Tax=Arundo donax TaxID=35708 RepID=A0A0A9C3K7_ARUDO